MSAFLQQQYPSPSIERADAASLDPNRSVTLYHFGLSLCSQNVRITIREKGIAWHNNEINLLADANLQPDYMRINPRGVVPTLMDGDFKVYDSTVIMRYLERYFPGPALLPENEAERQVMEHWLMVQDSFPLHELTYGNMPGIVGKRVRSAVPKRLEMT